MTWVYQRASELDAITSAWKAGRPVVLHGPTGVGKTALARQFAAGIGRRPLWIIGTPAMADTPLGAVGAAVPVAVTDGPSEIVARLRSRLTAGAMVIVEAAEHLDSASAAIVGRLLSSVENAGVVTAGAQLDSSLVSVLRQAGVVDIPVSPLDLSASTALVEKRLGGPLAIPDAVQLHRVCAGNPFCLKELVDGALLSGALSEWSDGSWRLRNGTLLTEGLRGAGAERLAAASSDELRLLDLLTLCEPLPMRVVERLELTNGVSYAEGGLVLPLDDTVVPGHAIFVELRRAELGTLQRRRLAIELIDALESSSGTPVERLHRARLSLENGVPLAAVTATECAATAFLLGDLALAAALAQRAVDDGGGLGALLQLSRARAAMGDGAGANALLAEVDPDALSETELAGYAITATINHTVGLGDHARALAELDAAEPRITSAEMLAAFAALRAMVHLNEGNQWAALHWARRAQGSGVGAPLWTSLAQFVEAEALRRLGETRRPIVMAREAVVATQGLGALVGAGARRTLVQALLADGDVDGAQCEADAMLEATLLQHTPRAIACSTIALVEAAQGRFTQARRSCEDALAALDQNDRTGLGRTTAAQLALICAATGDLDGAKRAHAAAVRMIAKPEGWDGTCVRLADAAIQVVRGDVVSAFVTFRSVAADCMAESQIADAQVALNSAARLGDHMAARERGALASNGADDAMLCTHDIRRAAHLRS